jgi:hypothetical protein
LFVWKDRDWCRKVSSSEVVPLIDSQEFPISVQPFPRKSWVGLGDLVNIWMIIKGIGGPALFSQRTERTISSAGRHPSSAGRISVAAPGTCAFTLSLVGHSTLPFFYQYFVF